jgi:hypothetical protein
MMLLSVFTLSNCPITNGLNKKSKISKVVYFSQGTEKDIKVKNIITFEESVQELIAGIDDVVKQIVTKNVIKRSKDNASGIEIYFSETIAVNTKNGKSLNIDKLLIPYPILSDSQEKSSIVEIYYGGKEFYTPPYINSIGRSVLDKIKSLVEE